VQDSERARDVVDQLEVAPQLAPDAGTLRRP
jgi:hypothetical protein